MQAQRQLLTVGNFMSSPVITVACHADLIDAISVMTLRNIGNIVVINDGEPVGVLTELELLSYLSLKKEIQDILVGEVSLRGFAQRTVDTGIEDAARMMVSRRSRLLVFKRDDLWQQKLVGIVTPSDLLRAFLETGSNPLIRGVIRRKVFALDYNRTILAAVKTMYRHGIGSVIVEKNGTPYGIFTKRDLLKNVLPRHMSLDDKIGKYYSRPVRMHRLKIDANTAGNVMIANAIKQLPLKYRDKITGIVTARDRVAAFWRDS